MSDGTTFLHPQQPTSVEIHMADGVFIKQMRVPKAMTYIPQHSHKYDHTSMLAKGSVEVFENGQRTASLTAPAGILIRAGVKHTFMTLEDDTIVYCIHNVMRTGEIEVLEEHQLVKA